MTPKIDIDDESAERTADKDAETEESPDCKVEENSSEAVTTEADEEAPEKSLEEVRNEQDSLLENSFKIAVKAKLQEDKVVIYLVLLLKIMFRELFLFSVRHSSLNIFSHQYQTEKNSK